MAANPPAAGRRVVAAVSTALIVAVSAGEALDAGIVVVACWAAGRSGAVVADVAGVPGGGVVAVAIAASWLVTSGSLSSSNTLAAGSGA